VAPVPVVAPVDPPVLDIESKSPTKAPSVRAPTGPSERKPTKPDAETKPRARPSRPRSKPRQKPRTSEPSAKPVRQRRPRVMQTPEPTMRPRRRTSRPSEMVPVMKESGFDEQAAAVSLPGGGELPTLLEALDFSRLFQRKRAFSVDDNNTRN
jgi:hypothetical protein